MEWITTLRRKAAEEIGRLGIEVQPLVVTVAASAFLILPRYLSRGFEREARRLLSPEGVRMMHDLGINITFVCQFILPCIVLLCLRKRLRESGLGIGDVRFGAKACLLCVVLYLPAFLLLFHDPQTQRYYAHGAKMYDWGTFFLWHVPSVVLLMLQTEFFFRGFLLLGIRRVTGDFYAILLQNIPYVLLHRGKPGLEALGSIPVGLALGYLAARTGSVWYGVALHGGIALLFEVMIRLLR